MTTLIKNALISDGTERPLYRSDLVFEGSTIKDIGHFENADKIIDADGLILCPGFMDMHAHSDLEILRNPSMNHKLGQGITFDVSGNCGVGVFPRPIDGPPSFFDILGRYDNWDWTDYPSYLERVHSPFNIVFLQNHAMLRMSAIKGNPNRKATAEEVKTMCNLLEKSLDQGCIGLSSGLYYAPNMYADEEEILALLRVVKKHNKMFCVHHRCEGDFILESVDEVLTYAQKTGVKLEISHLKAIGTKNQCKMDQVLEKIHNARENGVDVLFDQYPYEYGSTSLYSLLPPSYLKLSHRDLVSALTKVLHDKAEKDALVEEIQHPHGWDSVIELCGFDNISVAVLETNPQYRGMTLNQCAEVMKCDPYDALFKLLIEEKGSALMFDITQSTENLIKIMKDPLMCFGTDALYTGNAAHPRSSSASIHALDFFCKRTPVFTWEQMINRMTGRVADRLGIKDRGHLVKGAKADLVLFNPNTLRDNSSTENPYAKCSGIEAVWSNGTKAFQGCRNLSVQDSSDG